MAKKQTELIQGKRLVINATEANLTKNEILVKKENGKIILKERSNFGIENITPEFNFREFNRYFIKDLTNPYCEVDLTTLSDDYSGALLINPPYEVKYSNAYRPYVILGICGKPTSADLVIMQNLNLIEISKEDWYCNNYNSKLFFGKGMATKIDKSTEKRLLFLYNKFGNTEIPRNQYYTTWVWDTDVAFILKNVNIENGEIYVQGWIGSGDFSEMFKVAVVD